ncbi:MAG TPA: hypothetical protein DIC34_02240 [Treponema sp.]|nr:MAG: hypothetical protein A2001_09175 [Treponema sp. GWC1_61_84]HCM25363.1 hypothetical protein [Treponema sp.]
MLQERTLINACYILRERLGEDSFCELWRASAIFVASDFLIRFLKPEYSGDEEAIASFVKEARAMYRLSAPAVEDIVELDRFEGRLFLVTDSSGGKDIRKTLETGLRFTVDHACRLVAELAEGVDAYHRRGMTYGVLTPESVVARRNGDRIESIRIRKPGYAAFFRSIPETASADFRENWGYASPEFKRGEALDARSDVYSLGALLFRMLAGKLPYGSRSGRTVRYRSVSPAHAAAALARRGVPRELTISVVRSLRNKPGNRQADAIVLLRELRAFLDERREQALKAGLADPLAELSTLNLQKAKAGAAEIVRSLDTVEYFRAMSLAGVRSSSGPSIHPGITVPSYAEWGGFDEIEEEEADGPEDDDIITAEAFADAGYRASEENRKAEPPHPPPPVLAEPVAIATAEPTSTIPPEMAPEPVGPQPVIREALTSEPVRDALPVASPPRTAEKIAGTAAKETKRKPPAAVVSWRKSGGSPERIAESIADAFSRALHSRGVFKFIEDPGPGRPARLMAEAIEAIREKAFVVDLDTFANGAGMTNLLGALRIGLTVACMRESAASRKLFAHRLKKTDPAGLLRAEPLGRVLFGFDEEAAPEAVTPEADAPERGADDLDTLSLASAIASFGRRTRPLVLIGRGAQAVDEPVHRFLVALAAMAARKPICVFMFFEPGKTGSWHALRALDAGR